MQGGIKMKLTFKQYADKVNACWLGKNIGGTLGAPFECIRGVYDIDYYTHDISKGVLPNDDLDLQLVWLNAAEKYGRNVNAEILGEYWITYVTADWSEYGAGKNNMRFGIAPPVSGWYNNHNKDSCGCFIRSELWACLAPGQPDLAVKYAYEDAICDHADEGMYGELFCAAVQSAAFLESDMKTLINIGLSYIPEDCAVAKAVKGALSCYENGLDWKEARKHILNLVPGSFGMLSGYKDQAPESDVSVGALGFDAPSNIGLMIMGWVYGEGDFSKSICIAAGCCEDGDCTAGTLASILGIIGGTAVFDKKWTDPIGDEIKTISIDLTKNPEQCIAVPKTVTELSRRVINLMPTFMYGKYSIDENGQFEFNETDSIIPVPERTGVFDYAPPREIYGISPVHIRKSTPLFDIKVIYDGNINVSEGVPKKFEVIFKNNIHRQQWLEMKLHLPEEWGCAPSKKMCVNLNQFHGGSKITKTEFTLNPGIITEGRYDILLEISSCGRLTKTYVPITLIAG